MRNSRVWTGARIYISILRLKNSDRKSIPSMAWWTGKPDLETKPRICWMFSRMARHEIEQVENSQHFPRYILKGTERWGISVAHHMGTLTTSTEVSVEGCDLIADSDVE